MNLNSISKKHTTRKSNIYAIVFFTTLGISFILSFVFFDVDYVDGKSMFPTLESGDLEISIKTPYCKIERQDIVNIKSNAIGEDIVKRVIGVEGDVIEMQNGVLKVNGNVINETYLDMISTDTFSYTVPKGHIFVMGDNREVSLDSRSSEVGFIPNTEIKSKLLIYIPKNKSIIGEWE